ncbi:MAG: LptF/LptG family permease [Rickettsiales bacterium]|jgi:lipopolysaccharide export system permease protein|nr:LptF/LptG family permease [Rickettsiales bacterium]
MKILDRYFTRQLAMFSVMLLLVLSGLAWMMQILSMLKFLIQYGIDLWGFLGLTVLMLPFIISIILPFAIFITVMFVYNRMIADQEIAAMAASGLSPMQLARPAITLAGILAVAHLVLNIWIVPATQVRFFDKQWEMRYGLAHLKLQESTFTQMSKGLVVFVEKVKSHDLFGLMLFDARNKASEMTISAGVGKMVNTDRGLSMVMTNGSIQYRDSGFIIGTFDSFDMDMNVSDKGNDTKFRARRTPTLELISVVRSGWNLDAKGYKDAISELATRFLGPLMGVILVLIGMAVLLKSSLLRRSGFNMASPAAVVLIAAAQTLFMMLLDMIVGIRGLFALCGLQIAAIIILLFVLMGKREKGREKRE